MFHMTWTKWRPIQKRLGNYAFRIYGRAYSKNYGKLPKTLKNIANRLESLVPQQCFTTAFLQRHEVNQGIRPHRDPINYTGFAVTGIFGGFSGAEMAIGRGSRVRLEPGDVLVQRCNVNPLPRPLYRMTQVTKGIRYSLTLNTVG